MANDRVPMTREGYEKEKARLERMQTHEMIEVAKRIADARALGDLSENAEYHAAREDQGMLQARIDQLEGKLRGPISWIAAACPTTPSSSARGFASRTSIPARKRCMISSVQAKRITITTESSQQTRRSKPVGQEDWRRGRDQSAAWCPPL